MLFLITLLACGACSEKKDTSEDTATELPE